MAKIPTIDTTKYTVVNKKFKDLCVKSENWYSDVGTSRWNTRQYDRHGRIVAGFYGERYEYYDRNDTLTKIEYRSEKQVLTGINKIEKFIYDKSGKVRTYIANYKERISNYNITNFHTDSIVILDVDQLYYDSLQRIIKIEHYSKSIANQELHLHLDSSTETLLQISTDTFNYDLRQRTAVRVLSDSSLTEILFSQTFYDSANKVIKETTVWPFDNNYTIEKEFTYEGNKVICLIKRPDLILTDLTRLNSDEISTDYYNDSGLITKIIHFRVRLNLEDKIVIKYEFY